MSLFETCLQAAGNVNSPCRGLVVPCDAGFGRSQGSRVRPTHIDDKAPMRPRTVLQAVSARHKSTISPKEVTDMAVCLRIPTTIWSAMILPLLVVGCGQSEDDPAETPIAKPAAAPAKPQGPRQGAAPRLRTPKVKTNMHITVRGTATRPQQQTGRDTWIMWTGGNQKFFRLGSEKAGLVGIPVEYFRLLDSRGRPTRFQRLGLVNEPNFRQADQAGRVRPLARRVARRRHLPRHQGLRRADRRRRPAKVPQPQVR